MSKYIITIEDRSDGSLEITSTPALEHLAVLVEQPETMTQADIYAARVHAAILAEHRRVRIDGT
ncbi:MULTISPECIES: hypothetical protein [Burkholderia cepacia complex]|uniref:hypothetical protein n=1 Tax=Burkholderia cepacia complex TaxID=87882 RepID=UPI0013DE5BA6|nr:MULTISPECIES: hypothetical protein [Burkholderia cepacia complex]